MDVDMRPEVVSQLLSTVEAKWTQEAVNVLSSHTSEAVAFGAMENSCVKVSSSVVQGSDGDRLRVIEYMKTVCNEPNAKANIEMCTNFGNSIQEFMIGDNVYNREQLDMHDFCHKFWNNYVMPAGQAAKKKIDEEEQHILAEEEKRQQEEIAQRKKLAEEAAKKKMREQIAQNHSSLTVASKWNVMQKKAANSTATITAVAPPVALPVSSASSNTSVPTINASVPTASTQNTVEIPKNATSEAGVQNSTKAIKSLMVHNATVAQNQTVQNATVENAQSDSSENQTKVGANQTQFQKNTTKLVLKNATVSQEQPKDKIALPSKLTEKVIKQLKFVLNRTKHSTQNITKNSTNVTA